jgi:hypothetical protein
MKQQKDSKKYHDIRRMFGRRQLFVSILIMLALAVTGVTAILVLSRAERIAVEEPVYQYVFSEPEVFVDGISMKKNTDGITVDNGYQQYKTNGYPFYYQNEKAMILTDSFIHMAADASTDGRVDYFTKITETEDGYVLDNPKDTVLKGGMLYDGDDVYIFLEETTVTINGLTRLIPALSYVVCFQGQSILIGYYGADEAVFEELDENGATATMDNGIRVDLVNDIYYRQNGTKHLLFASAEMFDKVQ